MGKYIFKFSALLFLLFFLSLKGAGQDNNKYETIVPRKSYTGISLGVFNNFHTAVIDGKKFSSNNPFFSLGLNYTKPFYENYELTFEYNLNIGNVKNKYNIDGENYSYNISYTSVNVPVSFRYLLNKNKADSWTPHFIQIGPVFNFNLTNNKTVTLSSLENNTYLNSKSNFLNPYSTSFRFGTGYTFSLKNVFIRTELNYSYGFNSFKKNTLPVGTMTKVTNDALGLNIIFESRNKYILKKKKG